MSYFTYVLFGQIVSLEQILKSIVAICIGLMIPLWGQGGK